MSDDPKQAIAGRIDRNEASPTDADTLRDTDDTEIFYLDATKSKVTKGAVQYMEDKGELGEGTLNGFYIRKSAFADLGHIPDRVRVRVTELAG